MFFGKAFVGQDILLSAAHQFGELFMAGRKCFDQLGPVLFRCCERVLVEGCSEYGGDDRAVLLADAGKRIAHEVHAAALNGGPEHLGRGGLQPLVVIGDDQTGAAQAAIGEGAEELVPEDLRLAGLDGNAENLAPAICHPAGDCAAICREGRLTATATMAATLIIRPARRTLM